MPRLLFTAMALALVFLSARASTTSSRTNYWAQGRSGGETHRMKKTHPSVPWVTELARAHGLVEPAAAAAQAARSGGKPQTQMSGGEPQKEISGVAPLYGLAAMRQGRLGCGALTQWSPEEQYLLNFWADGQICWNMMCSFEVSHLVAFEKPLPSNGPIRFSCEIWQPDKMDYEDFLKLSGLDRRNLEAQLGVSSDALRSFLSNPKALRVPMLPLQLMLKKVWRAVVVKGSDFARKSARFFTAQALQKELNFPPQQWSQEALALEKTREPVQREEHGALPFQAVHAGKLAEFLRTWSSVILNQIEDEDARMECQMAMEEHVLRLDNMHKAAEAGQNSRTQRSKESLLRALCASMYLRDRSKLAETFRLTLGCVAGLQEAIGMGVIPKLPSASQISECQIQIDAAFCCFWKNKFESWRRDCLIYMLADSSPQGGTDWLLSQMRVIETKNLQEVVEAQDYLHKSWAELKGLVSESISEAAPLAADSQRVEEITQERHAAGIFLRTHIIMHRQIPMALGSGAGAANLDQKLVCMCKKFLAETHRQTLTREIMHCVVSFCTDLGTESGFAEQAEGFGLADVLPQWMGDADLEPDEGAVLEPEQEADNAFLFANALSSPGLLHICFNMCDDVHKNLTHYAEWLPKFKALAELLHHQHLRKRFLAKCVLNTPFAWMASQLQAGIPKPAMWRWGTIHKALPQLLAKKRFLQLTWDARKFSSGDGEQEVQEQPRREDMEGDFEVNIVSAAIQSESFWLYTCMLSKLNQFPADLAAWAEGCACHPWLVQGENFDMNAESPQLDAGSTEAREVSDVLEQVRRSLGYAAGVGDGKFFRPCPLSGQRAVELASGQIWDRIDTWNESYLMQILEGNSCNDTAAIDAALGDFARGKAMIVEYLQQKLQCWETLPWKLAALNCGGSAAQATAQELMEQFDKHSDIEGSSALHHRITLKFLKQGSAGRRELQDFANGAELKDLPLLRSFVWSLRFIPTVERVQEGDHAITKRLVANRGKITGPYVSCRLRFEEIRQILDTPKDLEQLQKGFDEIRCPDDLAKRFGFWNHPLWKAAVAHKYSARLKNALAASILYAMDPATQFAKVTNARKARQKRKQEKQKRVQAVLKKIDPQSQAAPRWSEENVERHAVSRHLQERLMLGCLYSLSHVSLQFVGLKESLKRTFPQRELQQIDAGPSRPEEEAKQLSLVLEPDVEASGNFLSDGQSAHAKLEAVEEMLPDSGAGAALVRLSEEEAVDGSMANVVFLRIVNSAPSRRKNVDLPAYERKRLQASDLSVTFHKCSIYTTPRDASSEEQQAEPHVCVSVEPQAACGVSQQVHVLSICAQGAGLDLGALKQSMRKWEEEQGLIFGLNFCQVSLLASQILTNLVLQRCFPRCSLKECLSVDSSGAAMQELKSLNVVEDRGNGLWSLSDYGVRSIAHMHSVKKPCKVFRPAEELAAAPLEDIKQFTAWELLQVLWHKNWIMKRGPKKKADQKKLPPVTPDFATRFFYAHDVNVCGKHNVSYLRALCCCEELFADGCVVVLHHGQTDQYYQAVLNREQDGRLPEPGPLQLQDDAEVLALEMDVEQMPLVDSQRKERLNPGSVLAPFLDPLEKLFPHQNARASQAKDDTDDDASNVSDGDDACSSLEFLEESDGYSPSVARTEDLRNNAAEISHAEEVEDEDLACSGADIGGSGNPAESALENAEAHVEMDLDVADVEKKTKGSRRVAAQVSHPDSFDWGCFRFTFTGPDKRPPHGQWQAACPFHRLNAKTGCTRAMQVGPTPETKEAAKQKLQAWCLLAPLHDRKRHHTSAHVKTADALPSQVMDQKLKELPAPPSKPKTDEELDAAVPAAAAKAAGAAIPAKAKAQTKAKAKLKSAGKQPKRKAKPKTKTKRKRKANEISEETSESDSGGDSASAIPSSGAKSSGGSASASSDSSSSSSSSSD